MALSLSLSGNKKKGGVKIFVVVNTYMRRQRKQNNRVEIEKTTRVHIPGILKAGSVVSLTLLQYNGGPQQTGPTIVIKNSEIYRVMSVP